MGITVSQLQNADPAALGKSGAEWGKWAATVLDHAGYVKGQVTDPLSAGWDGFAADLAHQDVTHLQGRLEFSAGQIQQVEGALIKAGQEIATAKGELTAALAKVSTLRKSLGPKATLTVADTGDISITGTPVVDVNGQVTSIQGDIHKALTDAETADKDAAAALHGLFPPAAPPPAAPPTDLSGASSPSVTSPAAVDPGVTFTVPPATGGSLGADIVNYARQFADPNHPVPYVWGGTSPAGFDCSGLVEYVFAKYGIHLPRTADLQATVGAKFTDPSQLRPGDLVFSGWGSDVGSNGVGHVGIYAGNGMVLEASEPNTNVHFVPLNSNYLAHVKWFARDTG